MVIRSRNWGWLVGLAAVIGCGRATPSAVGTGARETARDYYLGLVRQDWQQAYAVLDPRSQSTLTLEKFTRLAQAYRGNIGFDPEDLVVQSCDEQGTEAVAHVVLTALSASRQRRYKDAIVLHQNRDGWRIILPATFGQRIR
jgi:hypothetical protein